MAFCGVPVHQCYGISVPHRMPLGSLQTGMMIRISGQTTSYCERFAINLEHNSDVALHFNPRFDEGCIVRNNKLYGNWQSEERHGSMPLVLGQPFEILLWADHHSYKIAVNGMHFTEFHHRVPFHNVNYLHIYENGQRTGQLTLHSVRVEPNNWGSPFHGGSHPVFNPTVPYRGHIHGGFEPGKAIRIMGQALYGDRFDFNLQCGSAPHPHSDIALHFNPRFDQSCVVRNHFQHGSYGSEERHASCFPFAKNAFFDVEIRCEPQHYHVTVNGQFFCTFNHRIHHFNRIDTLYIDGAVKINQIYS